MTEDRKQTILRVIEDGRKNKGYDLSNYEHRYFFVEKLYETDFKKVTPRAPMGSRNFDLTQIFGTEQFPQNVKEIAKLLEEKTWS